MNMNSNGKDASPSSSDEEELHSFWQAEADTHRNNMLKRRAIVFELEALDREARKRQSKPDLAVTAAAILMLAILIFMLFCQLFWNDFFMKFGNQLVLMFGISIIVIALMGARRSYSNNRMNAAFYESAASQFQHEVRATWKQLDDAEMQILKLRKQLEEQKNLLDSAQKDHDAR